MKNPVTVYYSLATCVRVSERYAKSNPTKVESLTLDPDFLRGQDITIATDGMPENLLAAREARKRWDLAQKVKDAKNAARRAASAAKRAATAAAKPGATGASVRRAVKGKKTSKGVVVIKSSETGEFVSPETAKAHPDTTYATRVKRPRKAGK